MKEIRGRELVSAVASPAVQNAGGVGIDQNGEAVSKSIGIVINKNRALVANAATENTTQTQQGATAAYFAAVSSTIADDLAVCTENSFQQRNGAEDGLPSVTVVHKALCN